MPPRPSILVNTTSAAGSWPQSPLAALSTRQDRLIFLAIELVFILFYYFGVSFLFSLSLSFCTAICASDGQVFTPPTTSRQ